MENPINNKIPSPQIFKLLSKEEQEAMMQLDSIRDFKKGDFLIKEGAIPKSSFFVVKGLVRKFRTKEAEEFTIDFYGAQESVYSVSSSSDPKPSKFSLECLEDSRISVVSFEKEQEIYKRFPRFERMCRETTEKSLMVYQEKFANYLSSSPEERYLDLLDNRSDLLDRVPQYQLASYLGVKPESLSRIRKRISLKL